MYISFDICPCCVLLSDASSSSSLEEDGVGGEWEEEKKEEAEEEEEEEGRWVGDINQPENAGSLSQKSPMKSQMSPMKSQKNPVSFEEIGPGALEGLLLRSQQHPHTHIFVMYYLPVSKDCRRFLPVCVS